MESTKECFRCGVTQELSHFYKHKQMSDGHLNKCKNCTKKDSKEREAQIRSTPEGVESERIRHKEKYHRLDYCTKQKEWDQKRPWKSNGKYKSLSKKLKLRGLISDGEIAHHWNYNDEFIEDVFILPSISVHKLIHTRISLNHNERIYYYKESPLLSKELHAQAIGDILNDITIKQVTLT